MTGGGVFQRAAMRANLYFRCVGTEAVRVLLRLERGEEMLTQAVKRPEHKRTYRGDLIPPSPQMGALVRAGLVRFERDMGRFGGYVLEPAGRTWLVQARAAGLLTLVDAQPEAQAVQAAMAA